MKIPEMTCDCISVSDTGIRARDMGKTIKCPVCGPRFKFVTIAAYDFETPEKETA